MSRARDLFVHAEEGRLRAPLRLALHAAGAFVVAAGAAAATPSEVPVELGWAAQLALVVLFTLGCARWLDHRTRWARPLGADARGLAELLAGAGLGAVLVGAIAGLEALLGLARYAAVVPDTAALVRGLVLFVAIAVSEELIFRGYQLTNLAEGLAGRRWPAARASWISLALSSATFGLAHAANPNATPTAVLEVTLAGVLLGLPFVLTRRLGVSIGLHLGWNTAQSLLDMPVSGQRVGEPMVVRTSLVDEAWLTGAAFGPEGGALGLAAIVLGVAVVLAVSRLREGRLAPAPELGVPPSTSRSHPPRSGGA